MPVALLAVLKAGGAYVPLDLSAPSERLRHVLQDSGLKLLLTHSQQRRRCLSWRVFSACASIR